MREHHAILEARMALDLVKPEAEMAARVRKRVKALLESFILGHVTANELIAKVEDEGKH